MTTTMTTKADGPKIRRLRERQGITATRLAIVAGIEPKLLSKIERGDRDGSPATRLKIAQALGVDLDDITYLIPSQSRARQATAA